MRTSLILTATGAALMLSACGQTTGDRAVSGAGIGAGVGAVGSAVTGGSPLTGALIGGAVGGVAGAATSPDQVNLAGRPGVNARLINAGFNRTAS